MKRLTRTLPVLSIMAVVATAAGITLGHSAVSEINPLYFASAPDRFHADQTALRPDWTQPQPALAAATATAGELGSGCLGCSSRGNGEYYAAPAVVTYTDGWRADAERAAAPAEPAFVEDAAPDPERERVVRYASYPLTQEEVRVETTEPVEAEPAAAAEVAVE